MKKNKPVYSQSYQDFWNNKGPYGENRVRSMIARKRRRYEKRKTAQRYKPFWHDEYGRMMQHCDYAGICEYPCNGDC
jgi:hypothetical protein